jgi:hypothetical protein
VGEPQDLIANGERGFAPGPLGMGRAQVCGAARYARRLFGAHCGTVVGATRIVQDEHFGIFLFYLTLSLRPARREKEKDKEKEERLAGGAF